MEPWSLTMTEGSAYEIEWPGRLEMGDQVFQFVNTLKAWGLKPSLTTNKKGGELRIGVHGFVAVYREGVYAEPGDEEWTIGDKFTTMTLEVETCWILQETHGAVMPPSVDTTGDPAASSPAPAYEDYAGLANEMSRYIPDIRKKVKYPCTCGEMGSIWYVIQHLNDDHHPNSEPDDPWTRERIADWLDEVDADLTFDPDLPKKRAEERRAVQEKVIDPQIAALMASEQAIAEKLAKLEESVKATSQTTWKLSAAVQEYAAHLKNVMAKIGAVPSPSAVNKEAVLEMVEKTFAAPDCECTICSKDPYEEES